MNERILKYTATAKITESVKKNISDQKGVAGIIWRNIGTKYMTSIAPIETVAETTTLSVIEEINIPTAISAAPHIKNANKLE